MLRATYTTTVDRGVQMLAHLRKRKKLWKSFSSLRLSASDEGEWPLAQKNKQFHNS
jgi:hypothetical protein